MCSKAVVAVIFAIGGVLSAAGPNESLMQTLML